ncbi:Uncharacterised protein [Starkeya nomas]|uniref:Phage tail collar domain-containing protein n=1 Tax=Starkeya nomas TaxID=2666134 RepID=A0A5S9NC05_9HYPH|nr:phage tail protein [Starkeya nomas]CAA0086850.1 Uncharacterised protein [Starkeya nomas]
MSQLYYGLVTAIGLAKLAASAAGGPSLTLSTMAFGDGGGAETAPTSAATGLVNERYRAMLVEKYPHPTNPSILYVEGIIPPGVGGWTMREAGIYDAAGDLIVIAKTPTINVALISEGASTEGVVRLPIVFDSASSVQILVDPTVLLATQGWVLDRVLTRPFITVDSATVTAPPANPAAHALYLVPAGATGAWASQEHKLAYYLGGWHYYAAPVAKHVAASDTGKLYRRLAGGWEALWVESEVRAVLSKAGFIVPPGANLPLLKAIRSLRLNAAPAGGTANALAVALDPAPTSYDDLKVLWIIPSANNGGGAMTININGLGAVPVTVAGAKPPAGALLVGVPAMLVRDATGYSIAGAPTTGALINTRTFATPGAASYIPTAGTQRVRVYCTAGGGSGGGCPLTAGTSNFGGAGGGGAGETRTIDVSVANLPATPIPLIVGAGAPGVDGDNGLTGGTSSFGSICTAIGGFGGSIGAQASSAHTQHGARGGVGGSGGVGIPGGAGDPAINMFNSNFVSGAGGRSYYGAGGNNLVTTSGHGFAAQVYGAGGGGAAAANGTALTRTGGAGGGGVIVIEEYA